MSRLSDQYAALLAAADDDPTHYVIATEWLGDSGLANFTAQMGMPPTNSHELVRFPSPNYPWDATWCARNCGWYPPEPETNDCIALVTVGKKLKRVVSRMRPLTGRQRLPS